MVDVHVVPKIDCWVVQQEGEQPIKVYKTKQEALDFAREYAKERKAYVVPHRKDGSVEFVESATEQGVKANQHVVPKGDGWAVIKENAQKATAIESTKMAAISRAKEVAEREGTRVIVHDSKGVITYNEEPSTFLELRAGLFG